MTDRQKPPVSVGDTVIDIGCSLAQEQRRHWPDDFPAEAGVVAKVFGSYLRLHRPGDPGDVWDCEHWVLPGADER